MPVNVQVYPGVLISLPQYVADKKGFFTKHGLKVSLVGANSAPEAFQAQISGGIDIVSSALSVGLVTAEQMRKSGGKDSEKAIMGSVGPLYYSIIGDKTKDWPKSDDPKTMLKALQGKTVGVASLGADTQRVLQGLMQLYGLDPASINFVAVGLAASAIAALQAHQIDALVASPPAGDILTFKGGAGVSLLDLRKGSSNPALNPWAFDDYFALSSWLDKNPKTAKAFQAATKETIAYMRDPKNLDEITQIFASGTSGLTPDQAKQVVKAFLPLYDNNINCAGTENVVNFYIKYAKTITQPVSCNDFAWEGASSYIQK